MSGDGRILPVVPATIEVRMSPDSRHRSHNLTPVTTAGNPPPSSTRTPAGAIHRIAPLVRRESHRSRQSLLFP
jgi:hypothetical protein